MKRTLLFFLNIKKKILSFVYTSLVKYTCGSLKGILRVNGYSVIGKNVHLGDNVNFNGMYISAGGKVTIGNNFHSGRDCMIIVRNHNYEGERIPYDSTYIHRDVNIEDNVWLGNRVIILGGVSIGEGAIIQAGAVVVKDIPKGGIAGGNPAKVFKYRNMDGYYKLKEEKKFH